MAYTTIKKPSDYFNTVLYTGTEPSNKAVTGVGFQPDWVWIKQRSGSEGHYLADVIRGSSYVLRSNENAVENNRGSNGIQSFDSDGFTAGGGDDINSSGGTFASWNWKANGAGSSNSDGSISSTISANTTSGFSIVKYTGSNSNVTVGHGLGVAPKMIIIKNLSSTSSWTVYHKSIGNGHRLVLNNDNAKESTNQFATTTPTSSVFTLGGGYNDVNATNQNYIAYCFAEKTGYSKFGSYTGNNLADGPFVYTGFKPAFVMLKRSNSGTQSWYVYDNKRDGYNGITDGYMLRPLWANSGSSEASVGNYKFDILSNGFKIRETGNQTNGSGHTYVYVALGQSLVGSNNVPCTGF